MDIQGFAFIKKGASTGLSAIDIKEFEQKICCVIEFGHQDSVLVLNDKQTALAMFEKEDVQYSFRCGYLSGVVTPPNMGMVEQLNYVNKVLREVGPLNRNVIMNLVIALSLQHGQFNDEILFKN